MDNQTLIGLALEARKNAYAPYSGFLVGAALLCSDGEVFTGCNIENASYPASNCAERTAFFQAVSCGKRDFVKLAVVGGRGEKEPERCCPPCGVCRQVMAEFCSGDFSVIMAKNQENYMEKRLDELLPCAFELEE